MYSTSALVSHVWAYGNVTFLSQSEVQQVFETVNNLYIKEWGGGGGAY